ncbi:MAG TPA: hypothetical protein VFV08_04730, partial [Puia sp.]|nr:hypothetical protein [Puia sp.]
GYVDQPSAKPFYVDTMWLSEKAIITEHGLFSSTSEALLKRGHFSDTSKYAVIYVYRPGKFTNSLGNYNIYFDNKFMCVAKNKSGYIFKVYKEGNFEVKSALYKDESSINLHIQFGKRYFVKSMIHWGIYKRLYNFKLEMAQMKPEDAKPEFEMVNLQN